MRWTLPLRCLRNHERIETPGTDDADTRATRHVHIGTRHHADERASGIAERDLSVAAGRDVLDRLGLRADDRGHRLMSLRIGQLADDVDPVQEHEECEGEAGPDRNSTAREGIETAAEPP